MNAYLALHAAPRGQMSGLAAGSAGDVEARVVVLPKAWAPAGRGVGKTVECSLSPGTIGLTLYEGEICVVRGSEAQCGLLRNLVEHSATGGTDDDERRAGSLLAFAAATSGERADAVAVEDDRLLALLDLAERFELFRVAGEAALALAYAPRLRVLLHRAFVDEVDRQVRRVPKRYVERDEELTAVRGRVLTRSIVRHRLSRVPRLECRFDELVTRTPVTAVVTAALERVAARGDAGDNSPAPRALSLRRRLAEIPAPSPAQALREVPRVRFTRLDRAWERALGLGAAVLRELDPAVHGGATRLQAFELKIPTWLVWEQVLMALLRPLAEQTGAQLLRPGQTVRGLKVAKPFRPPAPSESPLADYTWVGDSLVLLDAKYKLAATPPSADQYQAFAYTHLHRLGHARVQRYVLLYASLPGVDVTAGAELRREWDDDRPVTQRVVRVPFPAPEECRAAGWAAYRAGVAPQLGRVAAVA